MRNGRQLRKLEWPSFEGIRKVCVCAASGGNSDYQWCAVRAQCNSSPSVCEATVHIE